MPVVFVIAALLAGLGGAWTVGVAQEPTPGCQAASLAKLQEALAIAGRSGPVRAQAPLNQAAREDAGCTPLRGAGWSISGWVAARAAERSGGSEESLIGAREAVERLAAIGVRPEWRVESEYARAAIQAAMAAAQDERGEMALYLAQARSLSEQLALAGATPHWPLPIDAVEGELWLEVDRYQEARAAFERAAPTGIVLIGLARTRTRLNDHAGACRAYRQAVDKSDGDLLADAQASLTRLKCGAAAGR